MHEAYAAGLVDGEGYIGVAHVKAADTYAIRVAVAMVTKSTPILSMMQDRFGGRLNEMKPETDRNVPKTRWVVDGHQARDFLDSVLPHLVLKRDQATVCLDLQADIDRSRELRGRHHWCPGLRRTAEIAKQRVMELNSRGPQPDPPVLPKGRPVAIRRWGAWWEPDESLFGPVEFEGGFPANGEMIAGHVYERAPIAATAARPGLLPTPAASNPNDGESIQSWTARRDREKAKGRNGNGIGTPLGVAVQMLPTPTASDRHGPGQHGQGGADLRTTVSTLMPTPRASDGEKGGPNQRGSSGDLMLPSAVSSLGATTDPRSDAGN